MLQSCETLITKINEWQQEVLELEKLSEEFLSNSDEKLRPKIDATKQEIKKIAEEYQKLAYPELTNGQTLFWPEKEAFMEIVKALGEELKLEDFIKRNYIQVHAAHITKIYLIFRDLSQFSSMNLFLFQCLYGFTADTCKLKFFPTFNQSISKISLVSIPDIPIPEDLSCLVNLKEFLARFCNLKILPIFNPLISVIYVSDNPNIQIPKDLSYLVNLKKFFVSSCRLKTFPKLSKSLEEIGLCFNEKISTKDRRRIKKEHPNARILF